MKILHIASEYPPAKVYGLGRFVHGLARAQAALGDEVHVLTNSHGGAQDDEVVDGVHVHRIAWPNPPRPSDGHGEVLQWNHGVVARLLERRDALADVDVVVCHDWLAAIAGREAARVLDRPLVATFHDEVVGKRAGVLDDQSRFVRDLEALLAHDADLVLANSGYIARQLQRNYGVPDERLGVAPGGVDPAVVAVSSLARVEDYRAALAREDEVLVVYVGRLDPEKGLETLCDAIAQVTSERQDVRFIFAGTGRLEGYLRERVGPAARFVGYVVGEALAYLYRAADIVVVPSTYEPLGLVALEAMLAGATVVVSDAGGLPELVRDTLDGLVVPAGNARDLAWALADLAEEGTYRRWLAWSAQARARETFSWPTVAQVAREQYARVVGRRPTLREHPPALPPRPLVSVTLVTHEAPAHAEAALRSLCARTAWRPFEVVVVDNGSSTPAREQLRAAVAELAARGHDLRLIENDANRLFSAAQNQAIAAARGEYVCLFNDDAEVPPGAEEWLDGLVWLLEERNAGSVTPVTLHRDGRVYCAGAFGEGGHHDRERPDHPTLVPAPRSTEWNNMACLLTRRAFFSAEAAGPLDEAAPLEHYGSDRAWSLRLTRRLGLRHWVHPVRLFHHHGEASRAAASYAASATTRLPASIVLVAYDGLRYTAAALDAVLEHTPPPFELVLVCNGARDGTLERFRGLRDALGGRVAVQVIENATNLGYPLAANQGARAARGRHVVFLNNDAMVRPGWLAPLLEAASAPDVGVVTPKVLNLDGSVQNAGGILHHPDGAFTIPHADEDRLAPPVTAPREVDNAGGPCMLVTRRLLEQVAPDGAPFDAAFTPGYFEDSDLCLRARAAGFTLRYAPAAEVFHHGKATSSLVAREGQVDVWRRFEENRALFHERWREQLAADEARRAGGDAPRRLRIVLCYHRSDTTTAFYCEQALRRDHDVVTAGRGQELDLGDAATAADLVAAAGGEVDLLLVVEGETYVPAEVERAPCPTALWAIDNHLHADPARAGGGGHFALARRFDRLFVAQRDHVVPFEARGLAPSWLPLACDPERHALAAAEAQRDLDLVFVGHVLPLHGQRRRLLDRLRARFRLVERQGVFGAEMAGLYARARVVFNCSLAGDLNMRVFEGLASGALVVTDRAGNGLERLFSDGEHLALYGDDDDLERVISAYLAAPARRVQVARRGQRLATRHHTYAHRMRELVERVLAGPSPARLVASVTPTEVGS